MNAQKRIAILLMGIAGTGKYTVAKALEQQAGWILLDNHLINNPVFKAIRADGKSKLPPKVWELTRRIRATVLEAIETCAPEDTSYIMTGVLLEEDAQDQASYAQIRDFYERLNFTFVPVRLLCDADELYKRRTNPDRALRLKDTSADNARRELAAFNVLATHHAHELTLNVTHLTPQQSAAAIQNHALHVQSGPVLKP